MKKLAILSICLLFSGFASARVLHYACMHEGDSIFFKYFMEENVGEVAVSDGNMMILFPNESSYMSIVPVNERGLIQVFITSDSPEAALLLEFTPPSFSDFLNVPQFDRFGMPLLLGPGLPITPKTVDVSLSNNIAMARTTMECDFTHGV